MRQLRNSMLTVLYFLVCISNEIQHVFSIACNPAERKALLQFKDNFIVGPDHHRLCSWVVGGDCCQWEGVRCNNLTGHVTSLDIGGNCSVSVYPYGPSKVDSALAELKHLQHLDLSCNLFSGSEIPPFLGSLKKLQYLNLSSSFFKGDFPHQLGNLTQLRFLDLSINRYILAKSLEWLADLRNLHYLNLDGINLIQTSSPMKVILKLPSLIELRLSSCSLGYSYHSQDIINMSISSSRKLQILDLSSNYIPGPFPHFLANMSSLVFLDLSRNQFNQSLPKWFSNIRNLQHLDLSYNELPNVVEEIWGIIGESCHLNFLDISNNNNNKFALNSIVDVSVCNKRTLEELIMVKCNISGDLPSWLAQFMTLKVLSLSGNNFSGHVPLSLGLISSLQILDLSYNNFHGTVNQTFFTNLSSLFYLGLESNSLTIQLHSDWKPPFQLQYLLLGSCRINTTFPNWIQLQKELVVLDLSNTGIHGPLKNMYMPSLSWLNLANNHLSGSIPTTLCKLIKLFFLDFHQNQLSGSIPNCSLDQVYQYLAYVDLSSNRLSGPVPSWLTYFLNEQSVLKLNNNFLEGEVKNFTGLVTLDLGNNNLSGNLSLNDTFSTLQILRLRDNQISGKIPIELCSLPFLQVIDLANNHLVGTIPPCFGNLSGMHAQSPNYGGWGIAPQFPKTLDSSLFDIWNVEAVFEVLKGQLREYNAKKAILTNMDLSSNDLVGNIPSELTTLSGLVGLNLSNNQLKGRIPSKIGEMKALESLDLSSNEISGSIPQGLSEVSSLNYLNLSYNDLSGIIPTGSQLQTLENPSIYAGNPGLCGDPLPKKCSFNDYQKASPNNAIEPQEEEGEETHQKMWFYLVVMIGIAAGFWCVIGILLVKEKWRHAYFRFADVIADWIYVRTLCSIVRFKRKLK